MKYWRKMLLALFTLCLFAGMSFALPMTCPTAETCLDNIMMVGDVSYDGSDDPGLDCPCEDLTWPLEYVHFDCDAGFVDVGRCYIRPQEGEDSDFVASALQGYIPHELAWDEDDRLLYISYMQPDSPEYQGLDASPLITIFDPVDQTKWNFSVSDFGDADEWNYDPGGLALDAGNDILYILNRDPDDARLRAFDVSDPCCVKEKVCCQCSLCIDDDCLERFGFDEEIGKFELVEAGEMDFFEGKLYVTYMGYCGEGQGYDDEWYPIIAKWDPQTCELEGLVMVQCDRPCEDNEWFPVTSIEVKKDTLKDGDTKVLAFLTHRPVYKAEGAGSDTSWLHMVNLTDSMGGQYSGVSLNTKDLAMWGSLICDEGDDIVLKGLDVETECDCGDACEDGIVYVAAKRFAEGECNDNGMVLAFSYGWGSDGCDPKLTFKAKKELPCWWTPGDLVATYWIPETTVEVSGDPTEITVDITNFCNPCCDKDVCELPLDIYFDPAIIRFESATVQLDGFDAVALEPALTGDLDNGIASWADILHGFPVCLNENDAVVVKAFFSVIGSGDMAVWAYAGDCIDAAGWECFEVQGGTCPGYAFDVDGADVTELACPSEFSDPCIVCFELEEICDPCGTGTLCIYVDADEEPVMWKFEESAWMALAPDSVEEDVDFEGCTFDYKLCFEWDSELTAEKWCLVDAGYGDPLDSKDNTGGSSGVMGSSSGCNVGFSPAALLLAVPLLGLLRKR